MTPTNLPASIRARLRNLAERDRAEFGAILTRYALERMLYRISIGEHRDEFLLKGALLFDAWYDCPSKSTTASLSIRALSPRPTFAKMRDTPEFA